MLYRRVGWVLPLVLASCANTPPASSRGLVAGPIPLEPRPSAPTSVATVGSRSSSPASWPNVDISVEDTPLGLVMQQITLHSGKLIYFADPEIANERVTISLHDVPWDDAVRVIAFMARKTPFTYRDGAFIDWACTDWPEPPSWGSVQWIGVPAAPAAK